MSGFWSTLFTNLLALPKNLRSGLHPGTSDDDEGAARRLRRNFFYHLHPLKVRPRTLQPLVTLGLGVVTATLFLVLAVTGVLLMIVYIPTTREAYASMQDIQYAVAFGSFVRALHRWSAHGMVVVVFLHLVRVGAMGAFRRRELNWFLGLSLLLLTLVLAFTGYLLPWDQRSYWAVNVSTAMLDHIPLLGPALKALLVGGDQVGQPTLLRFYTLHVALLPALLLGLVALHLWRIRKDGGLAVPQAEPAPAVPAWPALVLREAILVVLVLAAFSLASSLIGAPLGAPLDPHRPDNPEKAPWYFLWVQEMVSYSAPVGGFVFPGLFFLGLLLWPLLDREDEGVGSWFGARSSRRAVLLALPAAIAAFVIFEVLFIRESGGAALVRTGSVLPDLLNPAALMLALAVLSFVFAGWITRSTRAAFLAALVVMLVAVVGCMLVGLCRGPGWVFYWPWEDWPLVS